jgi:hypothetical protein
MGIIVRESSSILEVTSLKELKLEEILELFLQINRIESKKILKKDEILNDPDL